MYIVARKAGTYPFLSEDFSDVPIILLSRERLMALVTLPGPEL
jgi:hypothetical protein